MKVAIAGGTGFVGRALTKELLNRGYEIVIFTRKKVVSSDKNIQYIQWLQHEIDNKKIEDIDIFINLAGESINSRWTKKQKQLILRSRVEATNEIVQMIQRMPNKPQILIQASAVGFYGTSLTKTFTEAELHPGEDFLATTVTNWEKSAQQVASVNVRTVYCRFGIILHKSEGALPRMALPYHLFTGGKIGTGQQWVSWIHIDDVVSGILYAIDQPELEGAVNFTTPHPVSMNTFGQLLGKTLHRPHWFPVPAFMLKFILGEMSILVLEGQKALPEKLVKHGFLFQYPQLEAALNDIYPTYKVP